MAEETLTTRKAKPIARANLKGATMKTIFQVWELTNTELFTGNESRKLVAEIPGTKRALLEWIKFGGVLPTHMGELRKSGDGYTYFTTIGRTYRAARVRV